MATVMNPQDIPVNDLPTKDLSYILPKLKERREGKYKSIHKDTEAATPVSSKFQWKTLVKYLVICLLVVTAIVVYTVTQVKQDRTLDSLVSASAQQSDDNARYELKLELDTRQLYQRCTGPHLKQAFPDVDYALFGYNILRGFPLTAGHDPGFTYPIFKAEYSPERLSADCRFFVPRGLVLAPGVSCLVSLSSTTVQTLYGFSKALGVFVSLEGDYSRGVANALKGVKPWGVSFSASMGYRSTSTAMTSGLNVVILSSAQCNYYFSKLIPEKAPKFDETFLSWVYKLNKAASDQEVYFHFFNMYGTHFPTEVTFGARYTSEHKMTSKYYESLRESGVDIGLLASYAGKFSISGELNVSAAEGKRVSKFLENVETKIIPVGSSPPRDGNAQTWASEIKENPIPISYKLSSIENLFTESYMGSLKLDYQKIHENILKFKPEYCSFLRNAGQVDSCDNLVPGVVLDNTRLTGRYRETAVTSISKCIDACLQDIHCVAITYCVSCLSSDVRYQTCYIFREKDEPASAIKTTESENIWQTNIFTEKLRTPYMLSNVSVTGIPRVFENEVDKRSDVMECEELCFADAHCSAFSFSKDNKQELKCELYSEKFITGLESEAGVDTYFLPLRTDGFSRQKTTTTEAASPNG